MAKISDIFVGLDIGTTEVRCVVGGRDNNTNQPSQILGIGIARNSGMKKGSIVHQEEVAEAIDIALGDVERTTGRRITSVTANINGIQVRSLSSSGVVAVGSSEGIVSENDLFRAEDASKSINLPDGREIIRVFARKYLLDGQDNIKNPIGMEGRRLGVESLILTGSSSSLRILESTAINSGISINNKTVSSLAVVEATLSRPAREHALAVVDVGATTTNMLIMDEGEVMHMAVIPIGGFNITNDLARGLQVSIDVAEMIKKEHLDLNQKDKRGNKTEVFGKERISFALSDIFEIVEPRLEELCEEIQKELKKAGYDRRLPGGLILAGGGSKVPGITDFFKKELKVYVKQAELQPTFEGLTESVNKPEYIVAAGLMVLDGMLPVDDQNSSGSMSFQSLKSKIKDFRSRFSKTN